MVESAKCLITLYLLYLCTQKLTQLYIQYSQVFQHTCSFHRILFSVRRHRCKLVSRSHRKKKKGFPPASQKQEFDPPAVTDSQKVGKIPDNGFQSLPTVATDLLVLLKKNVQANYFQELPFIQYFISQFTFSSSCLLYCIECSYDLFCGVQASASCFCNIAAKA